MLLVIDNYDSFTYNLVQYFGELGAELRIFRNDEISVAGIEKLAPSRIVISPGPCTPKEAGISSEVILTYGTRMPVLGVCLGHQCIGDVFGGDVVRADRLMHGKTSPILHDGAGVFKNLPNPFEATRYHSLLEARFLTASKSAQKPSRVKSWGSATNPSRFTECSSIRNPF